MAKGSVHVNIKNSNVMNQPKRIRARGSIHPCARCSGRGSIFSLLNGDVTCPTRKGKGKVRI